jgi:hypothetical protein
MPSKNSLSALKVNSKNTLNNLEKSQIQQNSPA